MQRTPRLNRSHTLIKRATVLTLLLAALPSLALAAPKVKSQWMDRQITIDGGADDWDGAQTFLKKAKMDVGVLNDGEFLYVSLVSTDREAQQQIMMQGLILWFDAKGGKAESFGVRYPLGLRATGALGKMRGENGETPSREQRRQMFEDSFKDLAILGPGDADSKQVAVAEAQGIQVVMKTVGERMVYELKIPLQAGDDQPHAIGAQAGEAIGIGIISPKPEGRRSVGAGSSGGGGGGGGFGASRVGGSGSFGDSGPPARAQSSSLKAWTTVQLAAGQ